MSRSLGIDHALVAVNDLAAIRETYLKLGFLNRGISRHPWGTDTTVMIFDRQLFEIVATGDETLLDTHETDGFRFGRHIQSHLEEREGVALTALNSDDAERDAVDLELRGVTVTGEILFGRDVVRRDGAADRTRTRLKILANSDYPRLSLFACQQYRRDLIEYPDWMNHPNGVHGIAGLKILAAPPHIASIAGWLERVHGSARRVSNDGLLEIPTERGVWTVIDTDMSARLHGVGATDFASPAMPSVVGIDLATPDPEYICDRAEEMGLGIRRQADHVVLPDAHRLGGICLRIGDFPVVAR